jgi:uncharacterized membrane protein YdjX (TVP38/TMEM64 family)
VDEGMSLLLVIVGAGGILAPISFILFHVLRQFLFIPVTLVCVAGGILFGSLLGTFYSLIGLMLSSFCFYLLIGRLPKIHERLSKLKNKWFGEYRNITVAQSAILRLIPFIHFHLLNFCLIEKNCEFKPYLKNSLLSNLPLAIAYSVFGEFMSRFTPLFMAFILLLLMMLAYFFREKAAIIKWRKFFKASQV